MLGDGLNLSQQILPFFKPKIHAALNHFVSPLVQKEAATYNGSGWSAVSVIECGKTTGVSCGSDVLLRRYRHRRQRSDLYSGTWASPGDIDMLGDLKSISCASGSFCVAVDGTGNAIIYSGGTWQTPHEIDVGRQLTSVSCTSPSACVAVDTGGGSSKQ